MTYIFLYIAIVSLLILNFIQDKEIKDLQKEADNNRRLLDLHFEWIMELKYGKK